MPRNRDKEGNLKLCPSCKELSSDGLIEIRNLINEELERRSQEIMKQSIAPDQPNGGTSHNSAYTKCPKCGGSGYYSGKSNGFITEKFKCDCSGTIV